ncbi:alkaline phosphatase D family protein [Komagataeibacter swingsii]|nr:alkaline phosphatase D [Komagataeibacter swingsii DSM 16373]
MSTLSRRTFLGAAGALALPSLVHAANLSDRGDTVFPFGVASGDPTADGFVLWTRLGTLPLLPGVAPRLPPSVNVDWEIAEDENMRHIVRKGSTPATAENGYSVHVEAEGLQPGRAYWYRFTAEGSQSQIGRTLTFPRDGQPTSSLRVAVASCAHWEMGWYSAYRHLAAENPDVVLFLGDYIYEHNAPPSRAALTVRSYGAPEATDLEGYRWRYALQKTDPDLQAAHAVAPWLPIWDDHEVKDDYSGIWAPAPEESIEAFSRRQRVAWQAWYENMPVRRTLRLPNGGMKIYRRAKYGDLAVIDLLDGRQYRSRQPCPVPPKYGDGRVISESCSDLEDPRRTFLGAEQEQWLFDGFRDHSKVWTIIAQDLMVASLRIPDQKGTGYRYWTDTWDGFHAARNRLTQALADYRPPNPIIFSGDYHSFFASNIRTRPHDEKKPIVASEILGTSITSLGPAYENIQKILPLNPDIKFFDSRKRGYVIADFSPRNMTARLMGITDIRDPASSVSVEKTYVIERGNAGLINA